MAGDFLLGFDPGGIGTFGWCVAADTPGLPPTVIATDVADSAAAAVSAALKALPHGGSVQAAAIDAPLVWSWSGVRVVDGLVRTAIAKAGAPHPAGTVQSVNSLRGACLAQGLLAGLALREACPEVAISEAHPKALRWLCPEALDVTGRTEHERDAILGTFSAWAMVHRPEGWFDLFEQEKDFYTPLDAPLAYLMPLAAGKVEP